MNIASSLALLLAWLLSGGGTATYYLPLFMTSPPAATLQRFGVGACPATAPALAYDWCYSWRPDPGDGGATVERVPMLWGAGDVGQPVGGNSAWLMGFNEPDVATQANITPDAAAVLWRAIEARYPDKRLVAPAPSMEGVNWLPEFRAAYVARYGAPPRLDALAFHCYWRLDSCLAVGQQMLAWAEAWAVPEVWATEFAFVPAWNANAEADARAFMAWLRAQPRITRIAPFVSYLEPGSWYWPDTRPEADPSLLTADGQLTEIGTWYLP